MIYRVIEKVVIVLAAAIPLLVIGALFVLSAAAQDVKFDSSGELLWPTGYREWVYVGTPLTPNDMNGGEAPYGLTRTATQRSTTSSLFVPTPRREP